MYICTRKFTMPMNDFTTFILDTNTLINNPEILEILISQRKNIIIPQIVLFELEKNISEVDSLKKIAISKVVENINRHHQQGEISIEETCASDLLPFGFNKTNPDCRILSIAIRHITERPILLTSDIIFQCRALSVNILALSWNEFLNFIQQDGFNVCKNFYKRESTNNKDRIKAIFIFDTHTLVTTLIEYPSGLKSFSEDYNVVIPSTFFDDLELIKLSPTSTKDSFYKLTYRLRDAFLNRHLLIEEVQPSLLPLENRNLPESNVLSIAKKLRSKHPIIYTADKTLAYYARCLGIDSADPGL